MRVLNQILEKSYQKFSQRTSLVMKMGYRTVSLSFANVYLISKKVALFLRDQGLKKEDKVLILAPNSPYWICLWWGSTLGGFVPVPLNVQSTPELIKKIAEQTEAKIIFKSLTLKQLLPPNLKVFSIEYLPEYLEGIDVSHFQKPQLKEDDILELMYTSGTTGDPKGVILTHKNLYSNLEALAKLIPMGPKDRVLSILPLSHIYEQTVGFLLPFSQGATIIYAHSPAAIAELLKKYKITHLAAVPEFLKIVMSRIEEKVKEEGKEKLFKRMMALAMKINNKVFSRLVFRKIHQRFGGKLHTIASGGSTLDPELEKKWNALGITLLQGYGLTETSPIITLNTYSERKIGSVGKVLPGVQVKIAKDGEILVKGPNVFKGYFKDEKKTKEAFTEDGWFKTGDLGEFDKDGFLYIKGRKKYLIKGPEAQNVYPEDIETELNKTEGVRDSSVVGLEMPGGRVQIHAVLLLKDEYKKKEKVEEIINKVNQRLLSFQQIRGWSIWEGEDFPRSATRKVKKEEVLKWLKEKEKGEIGEIKKKDKKDPLIELLAEISEIPAEKISKNTKISELNLDSLLRIELLAKIEEKFGVSIDESKIRSEMKVFDLEEMLKKEEKIIKEPLKNWPRHFFISLLRIFLQTFLIFPLAKTFVKLKVEGKENLKNLKLPAIFMPNHLSYLDSLVLAMALPLKIRKKVAFAAARDILYGQFKSISWLAELLFNAFPFPRREGANVRFGLEAIGELLDQGFSIVVYPEGQISKSGELLPFKKGAGLISVTMDCQVVPVKIKGTAEIIPPDKIFPQKRGEVLVKFGKPIQFKKSDSYLEATKKLEDAIKTL
jgi:long-chain acyl-CoA synthetase